MNLRQRGSRYSEGVLFMAGAAGFIIIFAGLRSGLKPDIEIWLSAALVVSLILHARMGFALTRAQSEIEMLRRLTARCGDDPSEAAKKIAPVFRLEPRTGLSSDDITTLERVKESIEGGRVDLYLQPIVSLPQRRVRYYEAFSRLRDASGVVLKPTDYLEAAERANRIGVIDNLILLRCVQAFRKLKNNDSQFSVFCNLSPATLYDTEFFNHFTDYLELNGDLSTRLVFEFTYPAVQMMHPKFEENLKSIAKRGFAFSVDHVHSLDVDWAALRAKNFRFVKAPSSLLLAASSGDASAIAKLRTFRKNLTEVGIDLIAEKIEIESHMPEILELGIDFGQGNLFGPPRPADFYVAGHSAPEEPLAKAS